LRLSKDSILISAAAIIFILVNSSDCAGTRPIIRPEPPKTTGAVGRPNNGSLSDGKQLVSLPGADVLEPDRCWGTPEAVDLLTYAVNETKKMFPNAPDILIGDFSKQNGGPLPPHISHQSGRDVDVGFYSAAHKKPRGFFEGGKDTIDLEMTWYFIETLLVTDRITFILVDQSIGKLLYDFAGEGYSEQRLAYWFQYPNAPGSREGIIRHAPRHRDHLHIRFKCPDNDSLCVP
jgi:murein endopeptidase